MTTFTPGSAPPPHAPIHFSTAAIVVFKCAAAARNDPSAASRMVSDSGTGRQPLGAPFDADDRSEVHAAFEDGVRNAGETTAIDASFGATEAREPIVSRNQFENQGQQKTERFKNLKLYEGQRRKADSLDHADGADGAWEKLRSMPCVCGGLATPPALSRVGLMITAGAAAACVSIAAAVHAERAPTSDDAESFVRFAPPPHDFANTIFATDFIPLGLREGRKTQKAFRHSRRHAPLRSPPSNPLSRSRPRAA